MRIYLYKLNFFKVSKLVLVSKIVLKLLKHMGGGVGFPCATTALSYDARSIDTSALKPYFLAFLEMLKNSGTNARDVKIH